VPISGPYVGAWNNLPLGTLNDDGYELSCTLQGQEVNETDAYGMTLVEAIWRGQNWRIRLRGLEWNKTGLLAILQMFGMTGAATTLTPALTAIGDRWTKYCQVLLLSAILNYPPSVPQALSASSAGFAPNSQSAFNLTSKVREFPLELVLFPYSSGGSSPQVTPFTTM
jgi:hypothetical protein